MYLPQGPICLRKSIGPFFIRKGGPSSRPPNRKLDNNKNYA